MSELTGAWRVHLQVRRPEWVFTKNAGGLFKPAKRPGILDGVNPIQDVSIPSVPEPEEDTWAYSPAEVKAHLARVPEPARTVIYVAAFVGQKLEPKAGIEPAT